MSRAESPSDTGLEQEEETIRELSAAVFASEIDRDLEGFLSYFAPDAIIQAGDAPTMDINSYRPYVIDFFEVPYKDVPLTEPRSITVADSGEIAYDVGQWKVVFDGEGEDAVLFGKSTIVWRKRDNEWKIVVLAFSMDAPAVPAAE